MPDLDAAWNQPPRPPDGRWRRLGAALPMRSALIAVGVVWLLGCVWSYQEQSAFAASRGFTFPHLLPLVIDGFAVSMAGVAWAASLDARPAVPARLATLLAVGASATSNGVWAYLRTNHDMVTVVLGISVPVAANLAFEVLLAELRRQVQRRRGLPPPVAVPYPRLIRIALAPWRTFGEWREMVLELTAMDHATGPRSPAPGPVPAHLSELPPADPPANRPERPRPAAALPAEPAPPGRIGAAPPADPAARRPGSPVPAGRSGAITTPVTASSTTPVTGTPVTAAADPDRTPADGSATGRPAPDGTTTRSTATDSAGDISRTPGDRPADLGAGRDDRRPLDPRVVRLAQHLARSGDTEELTGEMVSRLLDIDVAPRTGRRLLGQARELVHRDAQARAHGTEDPELSVIGGR